MERLDGSSPVPAGLRGGIVALGNFDGFHLGHQAVIGQAVTRAHAEGRPAIVATFDPHPMRFFRPDSAHFRLTTLDQRQELFAAAGADAMLVFGFDAALAGLTAEQFADRLAGPVGAGGVVTGADFTFGKGRTGNVASLTTLGQSLGFSVDTVQPVLSGEAPVSSSRIRQHLIAGEPRQAAALLTRPFAIRGAVEHGAKLGRQLGYPTANLSMGTYLRPRYGIYAVRGRLPDGRVLDGAANLGIRPTIAGAPTELLEPYFFDFDGDLYDQVIEVALIDFIRPEAKFESLDALKDQMARDCDTARTMLSR
ncbi:bifunctional riboflavin kinase/FAD synthetase [Sphingomonas sp. IW22]|uniref:bifunctional riboflavin kinase/FAD synthetase n=1 Tax=Sphingomonas sp. IW22 TaxID=3242489 RepID=UPI0035223B3A